MYLRTWTGSWWCGVELGGINQLTPLSFKDKVNWTCDLVVARFSIFKPPWTWSTTTLSRFPWIMHLFIRRTFTCPHLITHLDPPGGRTHLWIHMTDGPDAGAQVNIFSLYNTYLLQHYIIKNFCSHESRIAFIWSFVKFKYLVLGKQLCIIILPFTSWRQVL